LFGLDSFHLGLLEDTHDLGFQFHEVEREDDAAGMEDEIAAGGEQIDMAAEGLAEAALDAVALVSFAEDLAGGEADARGGRRGVGWERMRCIEADWRLRPEVE